MAKSKTKWRYLKKHRENATSNSITLMYSECQFSKIIQIFTLKGIVIFWWQQPQFSTDFDEIPLWGFAWLITFYSNPFGRCVSPLWKGQGTMTSLLPPPLKVFRDHVCVWLVLSSMSLQSNRGMLFMRVLYYADSYLG